MADELVALGAAVKLLGQLSELPKAKQLLADLDDKLQKLGEFQETKRQAEQLHTEVTGFAYQVQQDREKLMQQKEAHDRAAKVWVESSQEQQKKLEADQIELKAQLDFNVNRAVELRAWEDRLKAQDEETKRRRAILEQDEADYDARMAQLPRKRA